MPHPTPRREVVLLGAGHANAQVLRAWRTNPIPRAQLTCVSDHGFTVYSGMLPGLLAGQYEPDELRIDLERLCSAAGARLIQDEVVGLDVDAQALRFRNRPAIRYDALSIGVGSRPALPPGVGARDVATKPIQTFVDRLDAALADAAASSEGSIRITLVGGGAAGAELAMTLPRHVRDRQPKRATEFTLIDSGEAVLASHPPRTRRLFLRAAERQGVGLLTGRSVLQALEGGLLLSDGALLPTDLTVWATSAVGPPVVDRLGLAINHAGRLLTRPTLQSIDEDRIFAVGDAGVIRGAECPAAGVFAVRQGPRLWSNLRRLLAGQRLHAFRPQRSTLTLLNEGDGRAILSWRGLAIEGPAIWRLKDAIDRRFVRRFQA